MVNWRSADGAPSAARSGPAESPTETVKGSEAVGSAEAIAGVPELEETGVPVRVVVPPSPVREQGRPWSSARGRAQGY
ncbi:MAG: hypothetical protein ACKVG9_06790 [Rhodospirillales bacterium]|jgi:hypothetical protein